MTTFTTIPNSSLEPGKPIRSIDGLALRDNPLAIIEGDATAPRIVGKAIKRFQDMPVLTVSAANTYDAQIGSNPQSFLNGTSSLVNVVAYRYTIEKYTGSVRFKASQSGVGYLSIYKNNVLIIQYGWDYYYFTERTNDVSISPGDVIEWRIRIPNYSSEMSFQNGGVFATNAYIPRTAYVSQLDNLNP